MAKGFVDFVMKDGTLRDMAVTREHKDGSINGILFFDGVNDRTNLPVNVQANVDMNVVCWVKNVKLAEDKVKPKPGTFILIESEPEGFLQKLLKK